jgi:hypothetical protein
MSAIIERSRYDDPDKLKQVIKTLIKRQDMKILQAMLLARFLDKKIADLSLRCFIRKSLPGKLVKGLKAHVLGPLRLPSPQPDCTERFCSCAIDDAVVRIEEGSCAAGVGACESAIAVMPSPFPPCQLAFARPQKLPPSLVSASTAAVKKWKIWDEAYY